MFEENEPIRIYRKTLNAIIKEIESIEDIEESKFKQTVQEAFEGYDYEDIEELKCMDKWEDISQDGDHQVEVGIDHEHAYLLTISLTTKDNKITVTNVL